MPRPAVRARTFAPPSGGTLDTLEASLLALLTASERHEPDAPAATAFRSAMRGRGGDALAAGGIEAADYLLARVRQADPTKADVREAIIDVAWSGLPGWRS